MTGAVGLGGRGLGGRRPRSALRRSQERAGMLLTAPALVLVLVFVLFPLGFAVYISLTDWPLIGSYHFVGVDNYTALASDVVFRKSVLFTLLYTAIVTVPIFVVGYLLAMFVRSKRRGSTIFRTLLFLPFVVGLATESFILVLELQPGTGAVNFVLDKLGITDGSTAWLVESVPAMTAICVLVIWSASGLSMVLLMSGMQGISRDIYESAQVDGASRWDREWRITIPMMRRTIAMTLILSVIGSFLAFNQFYILTAGGPGTSTTTVLLWIYQKAFVQLKLGSATAYSVVLVVGLISMGQFFLLRDTDTDTGSRRRR